LGLNRRAKIGVSGDGAQGVTIRGTNVYYDSATGTAFVTCEDTTGDRG
jgi:hypothetical protein